MKVSILKRLEAVERAVSKRESPVYVMVYMNKEHGWTVAEHFTGKTKYTHISDFSEYVIPPEYAETNITLDLFKPDRNTLLLDDIEAGTVINGVDVDALKQGNTRRPDHAGGVFHFTGRELRRLAGLTDGDKCGISLIWEGHTDETRLDCFQAVLHPYR